VRRLEPWRYAPSLTPSFETRSSRARTAPQDEGFGKANGRLFGRPLQKKMDAIRYAVADVIHCSSFCFGAAPTWREAS
jgi:hypothetical protein